MQITPEVDPAIEDHAKPMNKLIPLFISRRYEIDLDEHLSQQNPAAEIVYAIAHAYITAARMLSRKQNALALLTGTAPTRTKVQLINEYVSDVVEAAATVTAHRESIDVAIRVLNGNYPAR